MDTPLKNQTTLSPLASKIQDSPVSNYISNLSPIEPVKSIRNDHTFNSLTFASPPYGFTPPPIGSPSETNFLQKRHHFSESSKPESCNLNSTCEGDSVVSEQLECSVPTENLELAVELPNTLKLSCGSPESDAELMDATNAVAAPESIVQSVIHHSKGGHSSFEREAHLRRICRAGFDWEMSISDATDLLNFNSPTIEENSAEEVPKTVDPGVMTFISNILLDNHNDTEMTESVGPIDSSEQCELEKFSTSETVCDLMEKDHAPAIVSRPFLNLNDNPSDTVDDKRQKCIPPSCKPTSQSHTIRRRCLVFKKAETHKKKLISDSSGSCSASLQSNCEAPTVEKELIQNTTGSGSAYSSARLPGIGLHLNALATTSDTNLTKVVEHETLASESQVLNIPNAKISYSSFTPGEDSRDEPSSLNYLEEVSVACKNGAHVAESTPHTCKRFFEESEHTSPKRKRFKSKHVGESGACKRCNCRRSKCLKLYCECFAAGLYCIEPCSCCDCFNKNIHVDIVQETRRLIELRNPLAFSPKVIGSTEAVSQFGEETYSTPASARHKRGCNCKKSSCLKKYCECFQGGAGCSMQCRCVGCKNTFGRKGGGLGVEETEVEGQSGVCEKNHSTIPSEICRPPPDQLPATDLNGRIKHISRHSGLSSFPRLEKHLHAIPEDETLETLDRPSTAQPRPIVVKSASPNSKRISPPHSHNYRIKFGSLTSWKGGRKLTLRSVLPFATL